MKELTFIRTHIEKWQQMETVADDAVEESPDRLAEVYMDITADLAFAQTHYPSSRITIYLNNLSATLHHAIYRNKREKWGRVITFWTREVPQTMFEERRLLLISFVIFSVSVLIGVISQLADIDFVRLILGDRYVDMTLDNIAHGRPMDVYAGAPEMGMFLQITLNNITVAVFVFAMGLLTSIGTGWQLFRNGVMLGCFGSLFYQHGLLGESLLTIFQHGTLEISAIIVAGAAGLALGNGFLFPGTYSRLESFQRGAKRGFKIVVGIVPLLVVAGFIEGFITRHTEVDDRIRFAVILVSLAFVIFYFIILPYYIGYHTSANYQQRINYNKNGNQYT